MMPSLSNIGVRRATFKREGLSSSKFLELIRLIMPNESTEQQFGH